METKGEIKETWRVDKMIGNQYARKHDTPQDTMVSIRCSMQERMSWKKKADKRAIPQGQWIREMLNNG